MRICQKEKGFKCKVNKMPQWLMLQHVGFLQWPIRFYAFKCHLCLFFITFCINLMCMCANFLLSDGDWSWMVYCTIIL
jgi:hypothetical protein